jgi:fatty acid desaturase
VQKLLRANLGGLFATLDLLSQELPMSIAEDSPTASFTLPVVAPSSVPDTSCDREGESSQGDLADFDFAGFDAALNELRKEVVAESSEADFKHLKRCELWGRLCTIVGYLTAWIPNPLSAFAIAQGLSIRWMMMHHIGHGGYDHVPTTPQRYKSRFFARGWRRPLDWLDWIYPDAWNREHNTQHHVYTGQLADPDLLERNLDFIRTSSWSRPTRYLVMGLLSLTWKLFYYAPTTLQELQESRGQGSLKAHRLPQASDFLRIWDPRILELWTKCILPYGLTQFVLLPGLFLLAWPWTDWAPWMAGSALLNTIAAEMITNFHTFLVVAPNHAGSDLYRFAVPPRGRAEFYVHQVLGTVNYRTGGNPNDIFHLWLNYQIEHHLWPNLSMTAYQRLAPRVRAVCERFGLPYIQESVWTRAKKMVDLCVGKTSMLVWEEHPLYRQRAGATERALEAAEVGVGAG